MADPSSTPTHRGEPRRDMLYAGTGRSLLAMMMIALVSVGGLLAVIALAGGRPWKSQTSPQWDWALGLTVSDRLGAAILNNSWSMLGLFATILVAVALTGRGLFSGQLGKGAPEGTLTGLQLGAFDGQLSIHLVGRIGIFCGNYLAISFLLVGMHAVQNFIESGFGGHWNIAAPVLPLMLGGVLLSAHIGVFVTGVDARLSELRSLEEKLSARCDAIAKRIPRQKELSRFGSARLIVWRTASLALVPCAILLISVPAARPSGDVIGYWSAFFVITLATSAVTVMTPWMTDILSGWSEQAFRVWWICVVIIVYLIWVSWVMGPLFTGSAHEWSPIALAGSVYAISVVTFVAHYRCVRKERGCDGPQLLSRLSPFLAMDRVVFGDRSRQLKMVRDQILDLEVRRGSTPRMTESEGKAHWLSVAGSD